MELSAIFLLLAVLILVSIYLYSPFIARTRRVADEEQEISSLMAERDRVINSLQELDFDHNLGKIPDEDYPTQRAELLQKGAEVLRKLAALEHAGGGDHWSRPGAAADFVDAHQNAAGRPGETFVAEGGHDRIAATSPGLR